MATQTEYSATVGDYYDGPIAFVAGVHYPLVEQECPHCHGSGLLVEGDDRPCDYADCDGDGKILVPDLDHALTWHDTHPAEDPEPSPDAHFEFARPDEPSHEHKYGGN